MVEDVHRPVTTKISRTCGEAGRMGAISAVAVLLLLYVSKAVAQTTVTRDFVSSIDPQRVSSECQPTWELDGLIKEEMNAGSSYQFGLSVEEDCTPTYLVDITTSDDERLIAVGSGDLDTSLADRDLTVCIREFTGTTTSEWVSQRLVILTVVSVAKKSSVLSIQPSIVSPFWTGELSVFIPDEYSWCSEVALQHSSDANQGSAFFLGSLQGLSTADTQAVTITFDETLESGLYSVHFRSSSEWVEQDLTFNVNEDTATEGLASATTTFYLNSGLETLRYPDRSGDQTASVPVASTFMQTLPESICPRARVTVGTEYGFLSIAYNEHVESNPLPTDDYVIDSFIELTGRTRDLNTMLASITHNVEGQSVLIPNVNIQAMCSEPCTQVLADGGAVAAAGSSPNAVDAILLSEARSNGVLMKIHPIETATGWDWGVGAVQDLGGELSTCDYSLEEMQVLDPEFQALSEVLETMASIEFWSTAEVVFSVVTTSVDLACPLFDVDVAADRLYEIVLVNSAIVPTNFWFTTPTDTEDVPFLPTFALRNPDLQILWPAPELLVAQPTGDETYTTSTDVLDWYATNDFPNVRGGISLPMSFIESDEFPAASVYELRQEGLEIFIPDVKTPDEIDIALAKGVMLAATDDPVIVYNHKKTACEAYVGEEKDGGDGEIITTGELAVAVTEVWRCPADPGGDVCSGHGECISSRCECDSGFGSLWCQDGFGSQTMTGLDPSAIDPGCLTSITFSGIPTGVATRVAFTLGGCTEDDELVSKITLEKTNTAWLTEPIPNSWRGRSAKVCLSLDDGVSYTQQTQVSMVISNTLGCNLITEVEPNFFFDGCDDTVMIHHGDSGPTEPYLVGLSATSSCVRSQYVSEVFVTPGQPLTFPSPIAKSSDDIQYFFCVLDDETWFRQSAKLTRSTVGSCTTIHNSTSYEIHPLCESEYHLQPPVEEDILLGLSVGCTSAAITPVNFNGTTFTLSDEFGLDMADTHLRLCVSWDDGDSWADQTQLPDFLVTQSPGCRAVEALEPDVGAALCPVSTNATGIPVGDISLAFSEDKDCTITRGLVTQFVEDETFHWVTGTIFLEDDVGKDFHVCMSVNNSLMLAQESVSFSIPIDSQPCTSIKGFSPWRVGYFCPLNFEVVGVSVVEGSTWAGLSHHPSCLQSSIVRSGSLNVDGTVSMNSFSEQELGTYYVCLSTDGGSNYQYQDGFTVSVEQLSTVQCSPDGTLMAAPASRSPSNWLIHFIPSALTFFIVCILPFLFL